MALYDPQQHRAHALLYGQDPGMGCRGFAALVLWVLGYPDQALQRGQEALALAHELAHPFSLAFALGQASQLHGFRREWPAVHERAEALMALAREQGFAQSLAARHDALGLGAGRAGTGGGGHRRRSARVWPPTGPRGPSSHGRCTWPGWRRPMGQGDSRQKGCACWPRRWLAAQNIGERWYEARTVTGSRASLLLALSVDHQAEAEACFQQALAMARRQQAKSWELRAAMSLARLWQQQGKRAEAHELLAPIYGWFTEGFDTADLQEAKALLEELGG